MRVTVTAVYRDEWATWQEHTATGLIEAARAVVALRRDGWQASVWYGELNLVPLG